MGPRAACVGGHCGSASTMDRHAPIGIDDEIHAASRKTEAVGFGAILLVWMALVVVLNLIRWGGGFPAGALTGAIEEGVARVESGAKGEVGEDLIRKAIRTQRGTFSFWSALRALDDFLIEPVVLAARAVVVATAFSAAAAVSGRSVQFDRALVDCARAQGFWVIGLAVQLALLIAFRRGENGVETSLAILLSPGTHSAALWLLLRQLDPFVLLGWFALARLGWKRGDAGLFGSFSLCAVLGLLEVGFRVVLGAVVGAVVRLSPLIK
jgi:hypothetical protein